MIIFKYPLSPDGTDILLPFNSDIMSVGVQRGEIFVWAMIEEDAPAECHYRFDVYPTGFPLPEHVGFFAGTVFLAEGNLVFHVFVNIEGGGS